MSRLHAVTCFTIFAKARSRLELYYLYPFLAVFCQKPPALISFFFYFVLCSLCVWVCVFPILHNFFVQQVAYTLYNILHALHIFAQKPIVLKFISSAAAAAAAAGVYEMHEMYGTHSVYEYYVK